MTGVTSTPIKDLRLAARHKAVAEELLKRHNLKICPVCGRLAFQSGCIDKHCTNYHRRYQGKETADISQQFSLDGNRGRVSTAPVVKAVRVVKANRIEG